MTDNHAEAMRSLLTRLEHPQTLRESLQDWDTGLWVHHSQVPYVKINPDPLHMDPLGIYLFPEKFDTEGQWANYPYRFVFRIKPEARILDLATASRATLEGLLDAAGGTGRAEYDEVTGRYPTDDHKKVADRVWEYMQRAFGYGKSAKAKWNGFLRQQGYDAVFDDLRAIHVAEVQMLVLNPRVLVPVSNERRTGSGFEAMQTVMRDLREMVVSLGLGLTIDEEPIRRRREDRYGRDGVIPCFRLKASMQIANPENPEDNYASLSIYTNETNGEPTHKGAVPTLVRVSLSWSRPRLGYGAGTQYNIAKRIYDDFGGIESFRKDLMKVFVDLPAQGVQY